MQNEGRARRPPPPPPRQCLARVWPRVASALATFVCFQAKLERGRVWWRPTSASISWLRAASHHLDCWRPPADDGAPRRPQRSAASPSGNILHGAPITDGGRVAIGAARGRPSRWDPAAVEQRDNARTACLAESAR
jgi:hypothetical protein